MTNSRHAEVGKAAEEIKYCDQSDQQNHNNQKGVFYAFVIQNDFLKRSKVSDSAVLLGNLKIGAGEGNRTLISGLGSPHSTTEPHPPALRRGKSALNGTLVSNAPPSGKWFASVHFATR